MCHLSFWVWVITQCDILQFRTLTCRRTQVTHSELARLLEEPFYVLSAHGRCHTDPPLTPKLLLPAHLEPVLATQLLQESFSLLPSPLFFLLFFLLLLSLACLSLPSSLSTSFFLAARKWTTALHDGPASPLLCHSGVHWRWTKTFETTS